jgi:small multidrug resistance pump
MLATAGVNTLGQLLLKLGSGQNFINVYLLAGISCYGLGTLMYILVLGKFNLSFAYPFVIGLTVIFTSIAGVTYLREDLSSLGWIGIGLLLSGIAAITLGKTL